MLIYLFYSCFQKYKKEDEIKEEDDEEDDEYKPGGQDYKSHGIAAKTAAGGFRRKSKKERMIKEEVQQDCQFSQFSTDNPDEVNACCFIFQRGLR